MVIVGELLMANASLPCWARKKQNPARRRGFAVVKLTVSQPFK
jgi:hypothetical protein